MRLKLMEQMIDFVKVNKLEVRYGKGAEVSWFICSDDNKKRCGNKPKLIVYDDEGLAYTYDNFVVTADIVFDEIKRNEDTLLVWYNKGIIMLRRNEVYDLPWDFDLI